MNAGHILSIAESSNFERPTAMVGRLINRRVAEAAVRRIQALLTGDTEAAVKIFCSKAARQAYDQIEQALPITAEEWMTLGGITERIAKALVDLLMKKNADTTTAQHPARLGAAMAKPGVAAPNYQVMTPQQLERVFSSHSFERPADIVGRLINEVVAEAAVRRIRTLLTGDEEKAVEIFCSKATRHAYARIEQALPITAKEWMALGAMSERIAKSLVDQLVKDRAVASTQTKRHLARIGKAMAKPDARRERP